MRIAAEGYKHTLTKYAILIAFPLQQWLHKSASMLRYMYIACLFLIVSFMRYAEKYSQPDRPGTTV